jgi:hypothetical protein
MKELMFIDLVDEYGLPFSFSAYGKRRDIRKVNTLGCVSGLNHGTDFVPKTVNDANKLIAWLQEWKSKQVISEKP